MRGFWIALTLGLAVAGPAFAHPGHAAGFSSGLSHPLSGVDHLLAMVAVGLFSARLGGHARWLGPLAFLSMAAVGGALGVAGAGLPLVEPGIALSVLCLGLAIAMRASMATPAAMAFVGVFAVFHGYAHGAEAPADVSGWAYGAGFLIATAALHLAGVAGGAAINGRRAAQVVGGSIALAGMALLAG